MTFLPLVLALVLAASAATLDPCSTGRLIAPDNDYYYPITHLKASSPYSTEYNGDVLDATFTMNVCTTVPCTGSQNTGLIAGCQSWQGGAAAMGLSSSVTYGFDVPYSDGFTATYTNGDQCNNGGHPIPRKFIVTFVCNSRVSTPQLSYVGETAHCVYEFTLTASDGPCKELVPDVSPMPTPPVCGQNFYPSSDHTYYYEPSKLIATTPYWDIDDSEGRFPYQYLVNICGTVSCEYSDADPNPAACQSWSSTGGEENTMALGSLNTMTITPASPPTGGYVVKYTGGDVCHDQSSRQSIIYVNCSPKDKTPRLEFLQEKTRCVLEFNLFAKDGACPVYTQSQTLPPPPAECPAQLQLSDKKSYYNIRGLTMFSGTPYVDTDERNGVEFTYTLNVCAEVPCGSTTAKPAAACQSWMAGGTVVSKSLGLVTLTNVELAEPETSGFILYYQGGDSCSGGDVRHSIVHAVCNTSAHTPIMSFNAETSHCEFDFTIQAAAACPVLANPPPPPVGCGATLTTPDGTLYYPYTQLQKTFAYYESDTDFDPPFEYRVNICTNVPCENSQNTLKDKAGACQSWTDSNGQHDNTMGLTSSAAFVAKPDNTGFTITYSGGDTCNRGNMDRTTVIDVVCSKNQENPLLEYQAETSHCVYEFKLTANDGACPIPLPPPDDGSSKKGIGGLAIFFIVLIVVIVVAIAAFVGYRFYKKRKGGEDAISAATFTAPTWGGLRAKLPCCAPKEYSFEPLGQEEVGGGAINDGGGDDEL